MVSPLLGFVAITVGLVALAPGVPAMPGRTGRAAFTVSVAAGEVCPPKVAVIAEVPAVTPVARPVFNPTVATAGVPEAQAAEAVTSTVGPKLMVAVAVNCLLPAMATENVAGVTAIDTTVAAVTVKVAAGEVWPPKVAVMAEVPAKNWWPLRRKE